MFVKKKSAAAAAAAKQVPAPVNVRSMLPFQPHFASVLVKAFEDRVKQGWTPPLMGGAKGGEYQTVHGLWVSQEYADRRGCKLLDTSDEKTAAVPLPLPQHWCGEPEVMAEVEPRVLYPAVCFSNPTKLVKEERPTPRCGLTGNFFRREELVDNLLLASSMLELKSPFWIKPDHPGLASGYLQLQEEESPITLSLTAAVFRFGVDLPQGFPSELASYIHPEAVADGSSLAGRNVFTGLVSANPWLKETAPQGWVSLDQLRAMWPPASTSKKPPAKGVTSLRTLEAYLQEQKQAGAGPEGTVIEVCQWDLYNAGALQQPGRLAYDRDGADGCGPNGGTAAEPFPAPAN